MIRSNVLFLLFFSFNPAPATPVAEGAPRIEDLLIQKAAQELKLEGALQERFAAEMRRLGEVKRRLRQDMAASLQKMEKSGDTDLKAYTEALGRYNRFRMEEFSAMRGVLGDEKMREYLLFRHKVYSKFKELLVTRDTNEF